MTAKTEQKTRHKSKTTASAPTPPKKERYFEASGGRKTSEARVRIFNSAGGLAVNEKDYRQYFSSLKDQSKVISPLDALKINDARFRISVRVKGGGIRAQAEAVRNAISKALVKFNPDFKKRLRRLGFITRDARMVERKKYGLKKARRAPQWQKR